MMAAVYKKPGVYIEEIPQNPLSVVQVETAIPAFVGYTEKAVVDGVDHHTEGTIEPVRVGSLSEYAHLFGGAPQPTRVEIELDTDNKVVQAKVVGVNLLYDSVRLFFANGGGDCFVVSVGRCNNDASYVDKSLLLDGLETLEKIDLPTLLVIPESVHLGVAEAGEIHAAMLSQCNTLRDRFALLDIVNGEREITSASDPVSDFRSNLGMNYLQYGAAYYPWIITTLPHRIDYDAIVEGTYTRNGNTVNDIKVLFNSEIVSAIQKMDIDIATKTTLVPPVAGNINNRGLLQGYATGLYDYFKKFFDLSFTDDTAANAAKSIHDKQVTPDSTFHRLLKILHGYNCHSQAPKSEASPETPEWNKPLIPNDLTSDFSPLTFPDPADHGNEIHVTPSTALNAAADFQSLSGQIERLVADFYAALTAVRKSRTDTLAEVDVVYKGIVNAVARQSLILPPSGAVAGVYATVDRERGVWKAPANVGLKEVKAPAVNVTDEMQERLHTDVDSGKSVKKSTAQFVFEPNNANTWVKVRGMIEDFLYLKWKEGALAGTQPKEAFFVRVGLGQTMTAQDILNGYMCVEIGIAVMRPAEFIIQKFSLKMQGSIQG